MPTPTNPQPTDANTHHSAILNDLIDMAHDLARAIHRRAMAEATAATEAATAALPPTPANAPDPTPDPTIAFDRIARCIRRTVALARHLATDPAPHAHPAPNPATRIARRAQLIRGVEDAIHVKRRLSDKTDADALYAELAERLEDPELEFDLQGRSVDEVIEEICRDLGIARQGRSYTWKRRTPRDIANLRARAAEPTPGQAATLQLIQGGKPEPASPPT